MDTPLMRVDSTPKLTLFSKSFPVLWQCDDCGQSLKLQNIMGTMHLHCNCQVAQVIKVGRIRASETGALEEKAFHHAKRYPIPKDNKVGQVSNGF